MRIELTLHEEPKSNGKVYWTATVKHRVDKESEENIVMQVVSETFIAGLGADYKSWFERVCARVMTELEKETTSQAILRRMLLMETTNV